MLFYPVLNINVQQFLIYKHTNLISKKNVVFFIISLFFFLVYYTQHKTHDLPPFLFQIKIYTNQKNHQNSHNNHLNRAKDTQMVGNFRKKVLFTHRNGFFLLVYVGHLTIVLVVFINIGVYTYEK